MDSQLLPKTCRAHPNKRSQQSSSLQFLPAIGASLIPILFPTGHMLLFYALWSGPPKLPVDRDRCTCSCWDTLYKGTYESGIGRYKHFYFNSTFITFKIWVVTVIGVIVLYETVKQLLHILFQRKLRWSMAFLFLSSIFSHYYAWWGTLNYYNDDFYSQWYHQLFFTISEFITTFLVFSHLDRTKPLSPTPLLIIANIALFHISLASWDQFISNVVLGEGKLHQVLRDLSFMSTDLIYLFVALFELWKYSEVNGESLRSILSSRSNLKLLLSVSGLLVVSSLILLR